eukprot:scaffold311759_cov31-Tisochrysis_lutea.AAC.4
MERAATSPSSSGSTAEGGGRARPLRAVAIEATACALSEADWVRVTRVAQHDCAVFSSLSSLVGRGLSL